MTHGDLAKNSVVLKSIICYFFFYFFYFGNCPRELHDSRPNFARHGAVILYLYIKKIVIILSTTISFIGEIHANNQ